MSERYLSRMCRVSLACSASIDSTPRTTRVRAQSRVSDTDGARTLVVLGVESIDAEQAKDTLHILLKYRSDIDRAAKELAGLDTGA